MYRCAYIYAYVCFPPSKRRLHISTPLQRRMNYDPVSLLQVGSQTPEMQQQSQGRQAAVRVLARQPQGMCSRLDADQRASAEGLSSALTWLHS